MVLFSTFCSYPQHVSLFCLHICRNFMPLVSSDSAAMYKLMYSIRLYTEGLNTLSNCSVNRVTVSYPYSQAYSGSEYSFDRMTHISYYTVITSLRQPSLHCSCSNLSLFSFLQLLYWIHKLKPMLSLYNSTSNPSSSEFVKKVDPSDFCHE